MAKHWKITKSKGKDEADVCVIFCLVHPLCLAMDMFSVCFCRCSESSELCQGEARS